MLLVSTESRILTSEYRKRPVEGLTTTVLVSLLFEIELFFLCFRAHDFFAEEAQEVFLEIDLM